MNIAAIATAPGTGGIAVIRVSGPDAFTITDTIFRARNPKRTIATAEAYTMLFGNIIDVNSGQSTADSRDAACCVLSVNDRKTNPDVDYCPSTVDCQILEISAKQNLNTECLTSLLYENAQMPDLSAGDIIISNLRHYEALTHALDSIDRVIEGLQANIPADFVAQDIREALFHLAEITGGEITTDEVLGNIFAHFCIGK